MGRGINYEPARVSSRYAELISERQQHEEHPLGVKERANLLDQAREHPAPEAAPAAAAPPAENDDFLAKIAKYVPAEMVTLTTLAFAAIKPGGAGVIVVVILGALLNVGYLFGTALATPATPPPRWYFYVLSVIAFGFWAAAIIAPFGEKVGINGTDIETKQTFALALAALIVPTLDSIATNLLPPKTK